MRVVHGIIHQSDPELTVGFPQLDQNRDVQRETLTVVKVSVQHTATQMTDTHGTRKQSFENRCVANKAVLPLITSK